MLSTEAATKKDRRTPSSVTMEHRHFAFIADVISGLSGRERQKMAELFADRCASTNGRFDRARFMRACNVGE